MPAATEALEAIREIMDYRCSSSVAEVHELIIPYLVPFYRLEEAAKEMGMDWPADKRGATWTVELSAELEDHDRTRPTRPTRTAITDLFRLLPEVIHAGDAVYEAHDTYPFVGRETVDRLARFARDLSAIVAYFDGQAVPRPPHPAEKVMPTPRWIHEKPWRLEYAGETIPFRIDAANVASIFRAFEASGWKEKIPSPFREDSVTLNNTLKHINKKARFPLSLRSDQLMILWERRTR